MNFPLESFRLKCKWLFRVSPLNLAKNFSLNSSASRLFPESLRPKTTENNIYDAWVGYGAARK